MRYYRKKNARLPPHVPRRWQVLVVAVYPAERDVGHGSQRLVRADAGDGNHHGAIVDGDAGEASTGEQNGYNAEISRKMMKHATYSGNS